MLGSIERWPSKVRGIPVDAGAYNQAQKWAPEDANIRANHSTVLWQLRNYQVARDTGLTAIGLDGRSVVAWFNVGVAQAFLEDYELALTAFDRVQQPAPEGIGRLAGRGFVLARLNRYDEATALLETVLQANPEHPLALSLSALEEMSTAPPPSLTEMSESGEEPAQTCLSTPGFVSRFG